MKDFLRSFFKLLWNKTFLGFLVGAILTALGVRYDISVVNNIICYLPGISGCEVQTTNVK